MKKIEKIKEMTVFEMADFLGELISCHEICENTCAGCEIKCSSDIMKAKFVEWLTSEDVEDVNEFEEEEIEDEEEVEVNSKGTNKAIKFNILDDESMKNAGFRFVDSLSRWYFCREKNDISFNVTIPTDGSDAWIDVLDEDFLQPYDYQYMLKKNHKAEFPNKVKEWVESWMEYLDEEGIIEGHKYGEYI